MEIIQLLLKKNGDFPNNTHLPVLLYKNVLKLQDNDTENEQIITGIFLYYNWGNCWVNGIYSYHHYHSNTHEVLGIVNGECSIQLGGERGVVYKLVKGDILIIPAGVAHKSVGNTNDFVCIGAYPEGTAYDMKYGEPGEQPAAEENIKRVALPANDPVYGNEGPLFDYWKVRSVTK